MARLNGSSSGGGGSSPLVVKLATVDNIDVTQIGNTLLYTVPNNKSVVVTQIINVCTSFTEGSKTSTATGSLGTNAPDYDNFIVGTGSTINKVGAYNDMIPLSGAGEFKVLTQNEDFYFKVDTQSNADVEIWSVYVLGYFI